MAEAWNEGSAKWVNFGRTSTTCECDEVKGQFTIDFSKSFIHFPGIQNLSFTFFWMQISPIYILSIKYHFFVCFASLIVADPFPIQSAPEVVVGRDQSSPPREVPTQGPLVAAVPPLGEAAHVRKTASVKKSASVTKSVSVKKIASAKSIASTKKKASAISRVVASSGAPVNINISGTNNVFHLIQGGPAPRGKHFLILFVQSK